MKGDCGLGHLTSKGYKQEEDNGKNLRKVYVDTGFLSPNYSNREVFFRTDGECFRRSFIFETNCGKARICEKYMLILGFFPQITLIMKCFVKQMVTVLEVVLFLIGKT